MTRLILLMWMTGALVASAQPQFSFGVLADIQYGDQDIVGKRDYRASMGKLRQAVSALNREPLEFVIQLGDLIDSKATDLEPILDVFNDLGARRYSVLGNHDFAASRAMLKRLLGMPAYYQFTVKGWRSLVVDGMDVSVGQPSGMQVLESLQKVNAANGHEWNGGIGRESTEVRRVRLIVAL